ncbi:hypothetical protein [Halomarina litorea]|nr:hypothetical protein [Halomarina sp. BCD28]
MSAFLAERSDQTAGEIDAAVDEYPTADPLEDRPIDASDDDSE